MVFIKTKAIISLAIVLLSSTAVIQVFAGENDSEFDETLWETTTKRQEEFDGITPFLTKTSEDRPVTQITPAMVKIEHRYSVPQAQNSGKKKYKPGKKDELLDYMTGASIVSGGTLLSLGVLAMIAMASKALLLAFGAIIITCLNASAAETTSGKHESSASASTVYEVIAEPPQEPSHELHGYSSEVVVRREPYTGTSSAKTEYDYFGHSHR